MVVKGKYNVMQKYWLVKTEPDTYSIDDLARDGKTSWDGVRNYQARNFLREMTVGDLVFIYHSSIPVPGIVGMGQVSALAAPDLSQFDPNSPYYDPKATAASPRWWAPQISFVSRFPFTISRDILLRHNITAQMRLLARGNRLSVMPVALGEAGVILLLLENP